MTEKLIKGWIVVNWKNGDLKISKRKPKMLGSFQIPIEMEVTLAIPEDFTTKIKGRIELSKSVVEKMVLEQI